MAIVQCHEQDYEDIRLAVVMNGGVSLAVWIGGVTLEVNRLTNARSLPGSVYYGLVELVQGKARVDVISGTSAGGINGAFLALAAVYGQDLAPLGILWAKRGAVGELLRSPSERAPASLMRGDDYFLPRLAEAFEQVYPRDPDRHYREPFTAPVDLTITTSILTGEPRVFHDDFGTPIAEVDHSGTFRFQRSATTSRDRDPFRHDELTAQLALAARSTASFPFAFEPSWCPVRKDGSGATAASEIDEQHPNMAGVAGFDHSRYLVDGGVLLNKPMVPALQSIRAQPAGHQVRRILCYVNPDPGECPADESDNRANRPGLAKTLLDSLVTLPMGQSIDAALDDLKDRNERARDRKESRLAVVASLGGHAEVLARELYTTYRVIRRRRAFAVIADHVMDAQTRPQLQAGQRLDRPEWTRAEVMAALETVTDVPFVPHEDLSVALDPAASWRWGLAAVERLGYLAVDVLRRAMWLVPIGSEQEPHPARTDLITLRTQLHERLGDLRVLRAEDTEFWQAQGKAVPAPPRESADRPQELNQWAAQACAAWARQERAATARAHAIALTDILVRTEAACRQLPTKGDPARAWAEEDRALLDGLLRALVPAPTAEGCLPRLLAMEVATYATGVSRDEVDQVVDLIQISANGPNSFGGSESAQKLAGVKLGHFAAFYKESWRVNDWVWGRLDGASRLVRAVLAPARLRQLGYTSENAFDAVKALATGCSDEEDAEALASMLEEQRCRDELTFLTEHTRPMPPSLPACSMAVARRLHLEILREHLQTLADAVQRDLDEGAATPSAGALFRNAYLEARSNHPDSIPAAQVFALFRESRIGEETLQHDVGSGLFANTISTAAAVTASTLTAGSKGPKLLRGIGKAVRGVAMLLYAMVRGTAMGGTAAALVTIALGAGGAFLAVFLLTRATPPLVPFVGVVVLLAGLAHASLRNQLQRQGWYLLAGLALTVAAGVLIAWLVPMLSPPWRPIVYNSLVLLGIGASIVGMMALGAINEIRRATVRQWDDSTEGADTAASTRGDRDQHARDRTRSPTPQ